jgi:uncharacterized membrane protein YvbJ
MYCPKCGTENDDNAYKCLACGEQLPHEEPGAEQQQYGGYQQPGAGQQYYGAQPGVEVPNHLVKAILVTLFCCLPLGVVSIIYAAQVNGALQTGNIEKAWDLSRKADQWGNASLIVGLIVGVLYILISIASVGAGY